MLKNTSKLALAAIILVLLSIGCATEAPPTAIIPSAPSSLPVPGTGPAQETDLSLKNLPAPVSVSVALVPMRGTPDPAAAAEGISSYFAICPVDFLILTGNPEEIETAAPIVAGERAGDVFYADDAAIIPFSYPEAQVLNSSTLRIATFKIAAFSLHEHINLTSDFADQASIGDEHLPAGILSQSGPIIVAATLNEPSFHDWTVFSHVPYRVPLEWEASRLIEESYGLFDAYEISRYSEETALGSTWKLGEFSERVDFLYFKDCALESISMADIPVLSDSSPSRRAIVAEFII